MAHTVVAAIEQLRTLNVIALQKKYQQIFGDASKSSTKQYLFRRIAGACRPTREAASASALAIEPCIADEADLRTRAPKGFLSAHGQRVVSGNGSWISCGDIGDQLGGCHLRYLYFSWGS